jgi:predicted nucleic acid-binding protein
MNGFLIDSNVLSELTRPAPAPAVIAWFESVDESLLHLSVLTLGEIRKGLTALELGRRRARLEVWLTTELVDRFAGRILAIDLAVAERWGELAGRARRKGVSMPVIDGLLTATAIHHRLTIVTRNIGDFDADAVGLFDPWGENHN